VSWAELHKRSEELASIAEVLVRRGQDDEAVRRYAEAAEKEEEALLLLDDEKPRTLGITATSAVALWLKAKEFAKAERVAVLALGRPATPEFARSDLRLLLQTLWTRAATENAGIKFMPGQVVVSVAGGEVVTGGAPLDLIVGKVQTIQSLFYRTIELVRGMPHRNRGGPVKEVQDSFRPWLFQAPPGSYQFSVAVQEPAQQKLFGKDVRSDEVAWKFMEILRSTTDQTGERLERLVPQRDYQNSFLKLARNLAPTGRLYSEMTIRSMDDSNGVVLMPESRAAINRTLKERTGDAPKEQRETLRGVLRALHLDRDWLEVQAEGKLVHVSGLQDAIDDVIGPMVNHAVTVTVTKLPNGSLRFVDIELEE
jgi:hypothetical protein